MEERVSVIPDFAKDNTDRNRTSPFAFMGNKFEFRGVGSSQSIAVANTMLNSILAIEMREMSNRIENNEKVIDVIKDYLSNHKRIIFNGDGYSHELEEEAKKRGFPNHNNTVSAINCLKDKAMTNVLTSLAVLSEKEVASRHEILLEIYAKAIQVEALTTVKMIKNQIYPSCIRYLGDLSKAALSIKQNGIDNDYLVEEIKELSELLKEINTLTKLLEETIKKAQMVRNELEKACSIWQKEVIKIMNELRKIVDDIETKIDSEYWPMPTYVDLLFKN